MIEKTMKTQVEIAHFNVPRYVKVPNSFCGIPISELSEETILELCEQFKEDVLKSAGYDGWNYAKDFAPEAETFVWIKVVNQPNKIISYFDGVKYFDPMVFMEGLLFENEKRQYYDKHFLITNVVRWRKIT